MADESSSSNDDDDDESRSALARSVFSGRWSV